MEKKIDKRDRLHVLSLFSYRVNYQLSSDHLSSRFHLFSNLLAGPVGTVR